MTRYTVVQCMNGAEVYDERAGRPIDYRPTVRAAELVAANLNRAGMPQERRFAEL